LQENKRFTSLLSLLS